MSKGRNALGKGLSALLESNDTDITVGNKTNLPGDTAIVGSITHVSLDSIEANPFQPRDTFEEEALKELAQSIKEQGIIQPITVRKLGYDKFQIISGERRFRASKLAGLKEVPAYIRVADDQAMLEMALVENIQRENLNAVEVAISYKRLLDECSLTQEQLSDRLGKNRTTITNYLRLLKLPPQIQAGIRDGKISMGHARALVNIDDIAVQLSLYQQIVTSDLSVRKVEELAKSGKKTQEKPAPSGKPEVSYELKRIQESLSSKFATRIELKAEAGGKGRIVIPYLSEDDLNRILDLLDY